MTTNKGFGSTPHTKVEQLDGYEPADIDRCFAGYRKQGLPPEEAGEMVQISFMYRMAEDEGLKPGVDVQFDPRKGIWLSPEMQDVMKKAVPEHVWNYYESEGLLTEDTEVSEVEGETVLSTRASCKFFLHVLRHPEETGDEGEKVRSLATYLLTKAGLSEFEAGQMIRKWIAGDDSLMGEMIVLMDGAINDTCNEQHQQKEEGK
jgi:hypothetical protein